MSSKLLLVGGGGHCKSVIDSLLNEYSADRVGIIDVRERVGQSISGVSVIGCDDDLENLVQQGYTHGFVTLGSVGEPARRIRLFHQLESCGYLLPNIIDPTANIGKQVKLANGIFIGKQVVVNVGTSIGKGAIINTASTVEHDCSIGEFVHLAPGSILCGGVQIGNHTHLGAGSIVKQGVRIGTNALVGMGSVVLKDVHENMVAYGNPCKEIRIR